MDAAGDGVGLMPAYLLDTNHVGLAVDRSSLVGQRLAKARLGGIRLGTCLPVLCEVEAGLQQVRRKAKYRQDLDHLLQQLRLWPIDLHMARIFGEIYMELRRAGRVLSQVDIMIASLARQMKLTTLTTDRDFEALRDIRTDDWSKP
jgi:tRNA(fMet)-specific endonuclease VapC